MSSLLCNMKKNFKIILFKGLIGLVIGIIFFIIYCLIRFKLDIYISRDGLFLSGFFIFVIGLISYVSNEGFFDSISYGFLTIPSLINTRKERKFKDLYEYRLSKEKIHKENKFSPLGYILSSLIFLLIALILFIATL